MLWSIGGLQDKEQISQLQYRNLQVKGKVGLRLVNITSH